MTYNFKTWRRISLADLSRIRKGIPRHGYTIENVKYLQRGLLCLRLMRGGMLERNAEKIAWPESSDPAVEYIEKIVRHLTAHGGVSTVKKIDLACGRPPEHGLYGHPHAQKNFSTIWIERTRETLVVLRSR